MKILIAGGTGSLGRALARALTGGGHEVVVLTRRDTAHASNPAPRPRAEQGSTAALHWSPDGSVGPWASAIDGADAVVNLAGESIAAGRWTPARKQAILDSRVSATRSLAAAIAAATRPPAVFLSGSAQGYYGERGDEEVTEESPPGSDFLAGVCVAWEAEARRVEGRTRVVLLRTGTVLSPDEGALPQMARPFRMFVGGVVGSGRQFLPWIHWRDWVGLALAALGDGRVRGPLNLSAPAPARNVDFSAALGRALHRPVWVPVPAFAVRAALGEMADALLLTSTRMVPRRALDLGYRFEFPRLDDALKDLLVSP